MFEYKSVISRLFNNNYELVEGTDEIFELDLALLEAESLGKKELINRSAYFKKIDNTETVHYKMCNLQNLDNIHKNSSFRTKTFFLDGKYSTGYATKLKEHYPHAKFIGFVDGIGWYVRKGDLKRMVNAYEDVFTFHKDELSRFELLLTNTFKKW